MKVFIVIPAYNEEEHIGDVLTACQHEGFADIIVVNDGSDDRTGEIAMQQGAIVVEHYINRGVGAATQTGIEAAKLLGADIVITMDADGQHSPKDISTILHPIMDQTADIVIGSRFLEKNNTIPLLRRFFNFLANIITMLLAGKYLTDSQSGMKGLGKKALENIYIAANGYEFSSEIIREASFIKLRIREVPVSVLYTEYSLSKGQNLATGIITIFKLIIRSLMR
jgi:glycosyltransferase involved in cell wall biosynthesis